MIINISLLLIASMVIVAQSAPMDTEDPGAWLARELGTIVPNPTKPINLSKKLSKEPIDSALVARWESASKKLNAGLSEDALKEMDIFIKETDPLIDTADNGNLITLIGYFHHGRMSALKQLNRYTEALVELQKIRQICLNFDVCQVQKVDEDIKKTEAELNRLGHYSVLGVQLNDAQKKEKIRSAYLRLLPILHPDKNRNLDKETQDYLANLLMKVRSSYQILSGQSS